MRSSVSSRWMVGVLLLVAVAVAVAVAAPLGVGAPAPVIATGPRQVALEDVRRAVTRTMASGTARLDATYRPAHGPPVTINGRTSLTGPEAEVEAAVAGEPPATVRLTERGAWLRAPGSPDWVPVPEAVATAGSRGWADVLRTLDPSRATVWADGAGRIVRVRLAPDRAGGVLDARFSAFGIEVGTVPP